MRPGPQHHRIGALPAPVNGLDTVSALADMDPLSAVQLNNFTSSGAGLRVRRGWRNHVTGFTKPVRTIIPYLKYPNDALADPEDSVELFAATDDGIYDVTTAGPAPSTPVVSFTGSPQYAGRCSYLQFGTEAKSWLIVCSEKLGAYIYDGTTWTKYTRNASPGVGQVIEATGEPTQVDPTKWVFVAAWKRRLIFVDQGSTKAWYLDTEAVGGECESFDFGAVMRTGGLLLGLVNWTQTGGEGLDDLLVAVGSAGDLAVYRGTDISNAYQITNIGVWNVGPPPPGRRAFSLVGGAPFLVTSFGVLPVSLLLDGGLNNVLTSGTQQSKQLRKIQQAIKVDFESRAANPEWELTYFPGDSSLIIVRPATPGGSGDDQLLYVFNMTTNAWMTHTGIPALTLSAVLGAIYAGTNDGRVLQVYTGDTDDAEIDGSGGQAIIATVTPAFTAGENPAQVKQALMTRAIWRSVRQPSYRVRMNVDYAITRWPTLNPPADSGSLARWDVSRWDESFWDGEPSINAQWRTTPAIGFTASPTLVVASVAETTLVSIDYMWKTGGPL